MYDPDETGQPKSLIEFHPMDLGNILAGTIKIYFKKPWLFFGIVSIIAGIPMAAFQIAVLYFYEMSKLMMTASSESFVPMIIGFTFLLIGSLVLNFFLQAVAGGGVVYGISRLILGQKVSVPDCLKAVWPVTRTIIIARCIAGAIIIALLIPMISVIGSQLNSYGIDDNYVIKLIVISISFILIYGVIIYLSIKYLFIPQIAVLEKPDAVTTLRRSWGVSIGYWWITFGTVIMIGLILLIIGLLLTTGVVEFTNWVTASTGMGQIAAFVINVVLHTIISLVTYPIALIAYTLIYFDLRVRREGFNLEDLAKAISVETPDDVTISDPVSQE